MYIQVDKDNIIRDCIDYEYPGYILFEGEIPQAVHGGWHKLIDGEIIEQIELNPFTIENKIQKAIDDFTESLIVGGIL